MIKPARTHPREREPRPNRPSARACDLPEVPLMRWALQALAAQLEANARCCRRAGNSEGEVWMRELVAHVERELHKLARVTPKRSDRTEHRTKRALFRAACRRSRAVHGYAVRWGAP
jgi:hypothetical protein